MNDPLPREQHMEVLSSGNNLDIIEDEDGSLWKVKFETWEKIKEWWKGIL